MKHHVLTFSWCKISLKLTNCWEIFWFLNRLYWLRNSSVEKISAGCIANWVNSWWADHVTAGEGWRHVRIKPPALEQPLIKHHLPGAGSWAGERQVWHFGRVQMALHRALALESGHNPSCYRGFSQQPLQRLRSQDGFARSQSQVLNQPLNFKQMYGVEAGGRQWEELFSGADLLECVLVSSAGWAVKSWEISPFPTMGLCQRRASHLRSCWFKLTLDLL